MRLPRLTSGVAIGLLTIGAVSCGSNSAGPVEPPASTTDRVLGIEECEEIETETLEGARAFPSPDDALASILPDTDIPNASSFEPSADPPSGQYSWDVLHESGVVVGKITAFETDEGWFLGEGMWCA